MDEKLYLRAAAAVSAHVPNLDVCGVTPTSSWYPGFCAALVESTNAQPLLVTIASANQKHQLERILVIETAVKNSVSEDFQEVVGGCPIARVNGADGVSFLIHRAPVGDRLDWLGTSTATAGSAVGQALAELHRASLSHVAALGVPVYAIEDWPQHLFTLLQSATATGGVRAELNEFFTEAFHSWPVFQPSCLHGDLSAECFYLDGDRVSALVDLAELHIGDPAYDLAWVYTCDSDEFISACTESYQREYAAADSTLLQRAQVLQLFQPIAWLAYCADTADVEGVKEAKEMVKQISLTDVEIV